MSPIYDPLLKRFSILEIKYLIEQIFLYLFENENGSDIEIKALSIELVYAPPSAKIYCKNRLEYCLISYYKQKN
jgi:hypothetical protein